MLITFNGQPREVPPGRLSALLVELLPASGCGAGVAVAVNGEVVPRSAQAECWLRPGDVIDVVSAVPGG
ncbi:sulfur carrier protein ThiS [Nocardioides gilvus]|uniref:sulfur carrier protein ThiS n=1 Tax=Nocardioides gilvus TaxID=1735589 RepID=UPI000D744862|nr:sulfur carrier protein ThiS [Nocardioides gilvus]